MGETLNLRQLKKFIAQGGNDGQLALVLFHLVIAAGALGLAAMYGYIAQVASSNGYWLHAAAHSFVAAFGVGTATFIVWQGLKYWRI